MKQLVSFLLLLHFGVMLSGMAISKPSYTDLYAGEDHILSLKQHEVLTGKDIEAQLIHFWFFGGDLPNNTPLESIDPTFNMVEGAVITYHSALAGYPFNPDHPNWRKASLERRNAPTPINYRPQGNSWIPYAESGMRGIQVRQPFTGDGGENTLFLHIPTTGYEDIMVRFAAIDQGEDENLMAAEKLLIDYALEEDGPWLTAGLEETELDLLHEIYQLYEIDLSAIAATNDNPDLVVRIRFDVPDPELDEGDRVAFNNIGVDGIPLTEPDTHTVTFVVQDISGQSIPNAVITLGPVTNDLGDYVFEDVMPGNYPYLIAAPGFHNASGNIAVVDGDVTETVIMIAEDDIIPDDLVLVHYWFFGGNLPNDTPLEQIAPVFDLTGGAMITYHSSLAGYPFDEDHPNWRKASLERRNRPTDMNYRPDGNDGTAYEDAGMRAIQVRQPFIGDAGENTLYVHVPTTAYRHPVLSFAAKDNGESAEVMAAEDLVIDYAIDDSGQWHTEGMGTVTYPLLFEQYQLFVVNFSGIDEANDNPHFTVRIRFDGPNLELDNGDRVVFNNFALDAKPMDDPNNTFNPERPNLSVNPNPASDYLNIDTDEQGLIISVHDLSGNLILRKQMSGKKLTLDTTPFRPGMYIIRATSTTTRQTRDVRVIIL
ncbi:MAG: T9SS C-terminal target domain-containing protein [Bacteroidia bacterium]|nr:MAG: T9SS C-terminal target domain-containing protein [Bacteroidia bacterium]